MKTLTFAQTIISDLANKIVAKTDRKSITINNFLEKQEPTTKVILNFFEISIKDDFLYLVCSSQAAYDALSMVGYSDLGLDDKVKIFIEPKRKIKVV